MTGQAPPAETSAHSKSQWSDVSLALPDEYRRARIDDDTAWDWTLVLKARRIPHRTSHDEDGWHILAPMARVSEAAWEIAAYETENPPQSKHPITPSLHSGFEAQGVALVMAMTAVHYAVITRPLPSWSLYPEDWVRLGAANARLILSGQWWRSVTALTLHADPAHFLGNAVIGGVFVACLCRVSGSGAAWLMFVLSGMLGNLANAWMRGGGHISVGASTAVFGAVGALGALSMVREGRLDFRRAAAPVVAGLALLGMLGTGGERTDLGAHLFGFMAGLPLGASCGRLIMVHGVPRQEMQWILGILALGLIVLSWTLALAN
ncbi:rhomboid family intramembrane serine protease [Desulfovibrio ferrophilus]|nr:rhomboid family intramembrane serine protease [Desulfovibrio ferrophilus]